MKTVCRRILLFLLCSQTFFSCRERLPIDKTDFPTSTLSGFVPGDYFSYDNWKLDFNGQQISSSYFRNSWTVADTGRVIRGWTRVIIIIDSTFDSNNRFVRRDSLLFRIGDNGDVWRWGFVQSLIAARETLNLAPQWDRIAALSQPLGTSWVIARIDSSIGAHTNQTVYGTIAATRDYVGPVTINGTARAILAYKIEITKPRLDYFFWLTDSPTSIADAIDNSDVLTNATLRLLRVIRTQR